METVEHGMVLASMGCDIAQGYGIGRPMPAEAIPAWLAQFRVSPDWLAWSQRPWKPEHLAEIHNRRKPD